MRAVVIRGVLYGTGLLALVVSVQTALMAVAPVQAPEIDGGSISAGLGLLAASVLLIRARRGSK